ncbi:MAG: hypothetical protein K5910_03720 [Bacteroidales bacterium]|nr:hypothetical protein [Bacteroidales bacterium]
MTDFVHYPADYGRSPVSDAEIPVHNCFHLFTQGLKEDSFYKSDELFKKVFNSTGILLIHRPVRILGFSQMSNHSHFTAVGERSACEEFISLYAIRTAQHSAYTEGGGLLSRIRPGIEPIRNLEYLLTCLSYGDRNPISAGMRHLPADYLWGSANLMFRKEGTLPPAEAVPVSTLTVREQRKRFNTNQKLPQNWLFLPGDLLWPGNFIDYRSAQEIFGNSPAKYFYYLSRNRQSLVRIGMGYGKKLSLTDREAREKISMMAEEQYRVSSVHDLSVTQRTWLAAKAKSRWGISPKQSARLLHLPQETLKNIID